MQIFLILALLIAIVAVIFAVQNVTVVAISFFAWKIQVSLAVALLMALGAGVLITLLLSIPGKLKGSWNSTTQKKKYSNLEAERDTLKAKIDALVAEQENYLKQVAASEREKVDLEEQLASVSAALMEAEKKTGPMAPPPAV